MPSFSCGLPPHISCTMLERRIIVLVVFVATAVSMTEGQRTNRLRPNNSTHLRPVRPTSNSTNFFKDFVRSTLCPDENDSLCHGHGKCLKLASEKKICLCTQGYIGYRCENKTAEPEVDANACPLIACLLHCPYGNKINATTKCPMCKCADDPCTNHTCEKGQMCFPSPDPKCPTCNPVADCRVREHCKLVQPKCRMACTNFGYKLNSDGCYTCDCAEDPCKTKECPAGRKCINHKSKCYMSSECRNFTEKYTTICRSENKPGKCKSVFTNTKGISNIATNLLSANSSCSFSCSDDTNCPGLEKCCSNGCGMACLAPDLNNATQCELDREAAFVNGHTTNIPECDSEGKFKPLQCYGQSCYCVNIHDGAKIRRIQKNLTDICEALSAKVKCSKKICTEKCPYGNKEDKDGCKTCKCKESECEDYECPEGKRCEIKAVPAENNLYYVYENRDKNKSYAVCVDATSWTCPNREEPLREDNKTVGCSMNTDICPATHYCYQHDNSTKSSIYRFCCPKLKHNEKLGVCGQSEKSLDHLKKRDVYHYSSRHCTTECQKDSDCDGPLKCCPTECKSWLTAGDRRTCQLPKVSNDTTCSKDMETAILSLKLKPANPVFIPRCQYTGAWQRVQCHDFYGVCWCVEESNGMRIPGTQVRGTPDCDNIDKSRPDEPVCLNKDPVRTCQLDVCQKATCPAHPRSVCRINPCGDKCVAEFFDRNNNKLDCMKGLSSCDVEAYDSHEIYLSWKNMHNYDQKLASHILDTYQETISGTPVEEESVEKAEKAAKEMFTQRETYARCPAVSVVTEVLDELGLGACTDECNSDAECGGASAMCCPGQSDCGHVCWDPADANQKSSKCEQMISLDNCDGGRYSLAFPWMISERWYYNRTDAKCYMYPKVCRDRNISWYNKAWETKLKCETNCQSVYPLRGVHIPKCHIVSSNDSAEDHGYDNTQCLDGMCWCVDKAGNPMKGTLSKGLLKCDSQGRVANASDTVAECRDGSVPAICDTACTDAVCYRSVPSTASIAPTSKDMKLGYSDFMKRRRLGSIEVRDIERLVKTLYQCQADPCNNCKTSFYDIDKKPVQCSKTPVCEQPMDVGDCTDGNMPRWHYDEEAGVCKSFFFHGCGGNANNFLTMQDCMLTCNAVVCEGGSEVQICEHACENATCSGFPEAICIPHPCSCEPQFLHPETLHTIGCNQDYSLCERHRVETERFSLLASSHADDIHIVECEEDGSFKPLQCHDFHKVCWCVNELGEEIKGSRVINDGTKDKLFQPCFASRVTGVEVQLEFKDCYDHVNKYADDFVPFFAEVLQVAMNISADDILTVNVTRVMRSGKLTQNVRVLCHIVALEGRDLASAADLLIMKLLLDKPPLSFHGAHLEVDVDGDIKIEVHHNGVEGLHGNGSLREEDTWKMYLARGAEGETGGSGEGVTAGVVSKVVMTGPSNAVLMGSLSAVAVVIVAVIIAILVVRIRRYKPDPQTLSFVNKNYDDPTETENKSTVNGTTCSQSVA